MLCATLDQMEFCYFIVFSAYYYRLHNSLCCKDIIIIEDDCTILKLTTDNGYLIFQYFLYANVVIA